MLIVRIAAAVLGIACFGLWFTLARPAVFGGPVVTIAVNGHSMDPTYATGDFLLVRAEPHYSVGDIVVYRIPDGNPASEARVVHRIVGGDASAGWIMQGDNNPSVDPWRPTDESIVGRVWLRVPRIAGVFGHLRRPLVLAVAIGFLTFALLVTPKGAFRRLWAWVAA